MIQLLPYRAAKNFVLLELGRRRHICNDNELAPMKPISNLFIDVTVLFLAESCVQSTILFSWFLLPYSSEGINCKVIYLQKNFPILPNTDVRQGSSVTFWTWEETVKNRFRVYKNTGKSIMVKYVLECQQKVQNNFAYVDT